MSALPHVDDSRCTGCGDCVLACPADCLAMTGVLPWLPRPEHCVRCELCVLICPEHAIEMKSVSGDSENHESPNRS
jgi:Fe-S-cluster-containing hydrogenase component 2